MPRARKKRPVIPIVDAFCGCGAASLGFERAESVQAKVVVGYDCDPVALSSFHTFHESAAAIEMTLGPEGASVSQFLRDVRRRLPARCTRWHLHLSPPCNRLSQVRMGRCAVGDGVALMKWCFAVVRSLPRGCTWTIENVSTRVTQSLVEREKRVRNEGEFDWAIVDCSQHGVPQSRKRLVCSSALAIDQLRRMRPLVVTPRRALAPLRTVPRDALLKSSTTNGKVRGEHRVTIGFRRYRDDQNCRSQDVPTYTITSHPLKIVRDDGGGLKVLRTMSVDEAAALQTFPVGVTFPCGRKEALSQIGRSLPPALAQRMLDACYGIV
jgi:site-specific DNA-cytosine methylase